MKTTILPVTFFALLLSACTKEEDNTNCSLNTSSIQGVYKITSVMKDGSEIFASDYEACERDDTYTFDNGIVTTSDAGMQCGSSDDDVSSYTLSGNMLTVTNPSGSGTYTVEKFTCASMNLVIIEDGAEYNYLFARE